MKKRKRNRSAKKAATHKKNTAVQDPVTQIFNWIRNNKFTAIRFFLTITVGIFLAIEFMALHLWGIPFEMSLKMVSLNIIDYIPVLLCFLAVIFFTGLLEILQILLDSKKLRVLSYIVCAIAYALILSSILQLSLFNKIKMIFFTLSYCPLYLKLVRTFYLKNSRELATNAMNFNNKKYKFPVVFIEILSMLLHIFIIIAFIGNIYSVIPIRHFIDKESQKVLICSVGDKAIVSGYQQKETSSGEKYILLDQNDVDLVHFNADDFLLQEEKLFISKNEIN